MSNNSLTILFISYGKGIYGANSTLISLMERLQKKHQIKPIVLTPGEGDFYDYLKKHNVEVISHKWYNWVSNKNKKGIKRYIKIFLKSILNLIHKRIILRKLKNRSIDIIHTNTSVTDIGLYLSKKMKIPHVWYFREFLEEDYNLSFNFGRKLSIKRIEEYSSILLSNSRAVKKKYQPYFSKDIQVIYNGFDLGKFRNANTNKRDTKKEQIEFVIVGLIHEGKNQLEVLKATKMLSEETNKFSLHIVGNGDQKYLKKLKSFVGKNELSKFVSFAGYIENVPDYLRTMDVGIIASKNEAFGRVTVEYMLSQMPVIGSNSGGTKEIIDDGETGFLYELSNYNDLKMKMRRLMKEPNLIDKMGIKAYDEAFRRYDIERYADEIHRLYKSL